MEKKELRIVYMGTPDFAVEPLRCLVEGGYNVVGVITMPDKPIGRHQTELSASPVKEYAVSQGLEVLQPANLKDEAFIAALRALKADLQIVVAFRMLPEVVWQMPPMGTFNLHASLLPRYRGAAPINWAIINGDTETGITTFFLQHAIDTGNVIQQERIPILPEDNAETIHDQLMVLGGRLVVETVDNILAGKVQPIPQEAMSLPVADYQRQAPKIFKDTCHINWEQPAEATRNFIRGLSPYPGAWSEFCVGGKPLTMKIYQSHTAACKSDNPIGTLFASDGHLYVQQPDAVQELDIVQVPGKKRMAAADFLRGMRLCLAFLVCCLLTLVSALPGQAQRRSIPEMRQTLVQVFPNRSVEKLKPVSSFIDGKARYEGRPTEARIFNNITVLSDANVGFAVMSNSSDAPAILAYGDHAIDPDNASPEFLFLMEQYDQQLADGVLTSASHKARQRRVSYVNVPSMLSTHWDQKAPYNNKCPLYEGSGARCLTGCVATSMAQVLNYHKLPNHMRGYKSYGYTTQGGKRMNYGFDFAHASFDWNNMPDKLTNLSSNAQKEAVSTLMYACGVATCMNYSPTSSAAFSYYGADGITNLMDGIKAYMSTFDEDLIIRELKAGHPVIYGGEKPSGEGHSFVIDGVTSNGYYCCNLGWSSQGDGKYLPTNMNGYSIKHDMMVIYPESGTPSCSPMQELKGSTITLVKKPATTLSLNQWYVMWNTRASSSPYSRGVGQTVFTHGMMPSEESAEQAANQIVRFLEGPYGTIYVQFGTGEYLGLIEEYAKKSANTTADALAEYTYGTLKPGYFYFRNNNCNLDAADASMLLQGWSLVLPTDTVNTSVWQLYPVTISGGTPPAPVQSEFSNDKTYTLRNTGYSQGYLVATDASDQHPTLRGVTTDHANGLFPGAAYHDAVDFTSKGSYWRILTEGDNQYLRNELTGKYLVNSGDRTPYTFTDTKTPIRISKNANGTYCFNTGTQAESYLCAATNVANPAAFWTSTDDGSIWTVAEAEMPKPTPQGDTYTIRLNGTDLYFTTNVVPDVNFTTFSLSEKPEDFVITPVEGTVNGFHITSTNGTRVGHTTINTWDFCDEASTWFITSLDGEPTGIYKNSIEGFGVNNSAADAGVFTDKRGQMWLIEPKKAVGVSATPIGNPSRTTISYMLNPYIRITQGRKEILR